MAVFDTSDSLYPKLFEFELQKPGRTLFSLKYSQKSKALVSEGISLTVERKDYLLLRV